MLLLMASTTVIESEQGHEGFNEKAWSGHMSSEELFEGSPPPYEETIAYRID